MRVAFVANLDAELELMAPDAYRPSSRMVAGMAARATFVQRQLAHALGAEVELLVPGERTRARDGCDTSLCWCPTPIAQQALREASAPPTDAPPLSVLQRVNHRAFCAALSPQLPGARFVRTLAELEAVLAAPRPSRGLLLKRPFGFAGRARKLVAADAPLDGALRTWAAASMQAYGVGLQVEPWVEIEAEFALHGLIARDSRVELGTPTRQRVDADGAWLASARVEDGDIDPVERQLLRATAEQVAHALIAAGYDGPFGIDAYRYRAADGAVAFHPLSEINARLSMGYVAGMGEATRRLLVEGA